MRTPRLPGAGLLLSLVALICAASLARRAPAVPPTLVPSDAAMRRYDAGLMRLDRALVALDTAIARGTGEQTAFRVARAAYKRVELFVEYHGRFAQRELNGAPLPKAEDEDPETPLAPAGLQVVEAALFPVPDASQREAARREVGFVRNAVGRLRTAGADTLGGDAFLFDAMKQEVARVATLGLAAFDATVSGDALAESAEALRGVRDALEPYFAPLTARDPARLTSVDAQLDSAIRALDTATADHFDRVTFLATRVQPLAHALDDARRALGVAPATRPRAWSAHAASVFDRDAFDPTYFAATDAPRPTPALVALGRDLFFDPALSPSARSCASCHLPDGAFTDGRARARLLPGHAGVSRNTPTLINAGLQPSLFWDNRVRTLEDQATDVLGSDSEMGGSLHGAAAALARRPQTAARFAAAFGVPAREAVNGTRLRLALAAYVRSLVALDSRFDRAVRGDAAVMTAEERRGFDLFMGKAACGTCHFAPLFGGATPPTFDEAEPEVIGVPVRAARRGTVDPDSGRFKVRRIDQHLFAFRTPTLRNVALTAPYMHNGVFRTLEAVVDFYDAGGGHGIGIRLPHQTLPTDSLHLAPGEKRALVAFMRTLTDTAVAPRAR